MVLPLYATLERLDPVLLEAAADLGARPWTVFFRVIVPLAGPGICAGSALVFIPCLGAYLTPDLLGGGKTVMIGNLVQNQFTTARDWPFGSAASLAWWRVEPLVPVYGKPARRFVKRLKGIQSVLGDHHDTVSAREYLRDLAAAPASSADGVLVLGILYDREHADAVRLESAFESAWKQAAKKKPRAWLS